MLFTVWKVSSINGKRLHVSSSQENEIENKMDDFRYEKNKYVYENNAEKLNNFHPRSHLITTYKSSSVFTL